MAKGSTLALRAVLLTCFGYSPALAGEWTTDFFNTNSGWVRNIGAVGQNTSDAAPDRWQGNDPFDPNSNTGETDSIAFATGYTPGGSTAGNSSLIQGGAYLFADIFPGRSDVKLWRSFSPLASSTVSLSLEWSVIDSLDATFPSLDTFSFDLRSADNMQSILKLSLTPSINALPNAYTLQTLVNTGSGVVTGTLADLGYRAVFIVDVDMTGSNYDLTLRQINPATRQTIGTFNFVEGGDLSDGLTAQDFGTISIDWDLTSNDPEDPGSNYIIVNNVSVVPEPSTYALLVLAGLAAAFWSRRRRA
jgi:hypothetical protein